MEGTGIPNKTLGLILFELLIAFLLLSMVLSLAYPHWQMWMTQIRINGLATRVRGAVSFARLSAITRGMVTTFCGSSDQHHCDGAWSRGQIVLADGVILRGYGPLPKNYRLRWKSNFSRDNSLQFRPDGFTQGQQGSFYVCALYGEGGNVIRILVTFSGRLRQVSEAGICPQAP